MDGLGKPVAGSLIVWPFRNPFNDNDNWIQVQVKVEFPVARMIRDIRWIAVTMELKDGAKTPEGEQDEDV